jgi:hypothetical protein
MICMHIVQEPRGSSQRHTQCISCLSISCPPRLSHSMVCKRVDRVSHRASDRVSAAPRAAPRASVSTACRQPLAMLSLRRGGRLRHDRRTRPPREARAVRRVCAYARRAGCRVRKARAMSRASLTRGGSAVTGVHGQSRRHVPSESRRHVPSESRRVLAHWPRRLVRRRDWSPVTATPCHGDALSRRRPVTATPCHGDALSRRRPVTATPCHGDALSRRRPVTATPCHGDALSRPRRLVRRRRPPGTSHYGTGAVLHQPPATSGTSRYGAGCARLALLGEPARCVKRRGAPAPAGQASAAFAAVPTRTSHWQVRRRLGPIIML